MNDELTTQVHLHIRNAMYNGAYGATVEDAAYHIMALVRADERRKIREALASPKTEDAVAQKVASLVGPLRFVGSDQSKLDHEQWMYIAGSVLDEALAAIDLSESEVAE